MLTTKTLACFWQGGHMGDSIVYGKNHNIASLSLSKGTNQQVHKQPIIDNVVASLSLSLKEQTNKFTNNP
jgi:hypothetical protein